MRGARNRAPIFLCARQGAHTRRCKSFADPTGGTASQKDKGVHREMKSEGSQRQSAGLTNRNRIRGIKAG